MGCFQPRTESSGGLIRGLQSHLTLTWGLPPSLATSETLTPTLSSSFLPLGSDLHHSLIVLPVFSGLSPHFFSWGCSPNQIHAHFILFWHQFLGRPRLRWYLIKYLYNQKMLLERKKVSRLFSTPVDPLSQVVGVQNYGYRFQPIYFHYSLSLWDCLSSPVIRVPHFPSQHFIQWDDKCLGFTST